jgi:hypothetical protein
MQGNKVRDGSFEAIDGKAKRAEAKNRPPLNRILLIWEKSKS